MNFVYQFGASPATSGHMSTCEEKTMSEIDRLKILERVAAGEISAAAAADLLQGNSAETAEPEALKEAEKHIVITEEPAPLAGNGKTPTWFKVRVNDLQTGKQRVAVNIPFRMMRWGLRVGQRFAPELRDLDANVLDQMVADGTPGMLVEVVDNEDNEQVQIFLE